MKTPAQKSNTSSNAPTAHETELSVRIDGLRKRDRELTEEIIALEKIGTAGVDLAALDLDEMAYATLMDVPVAKKLRTETPRDLKAVYHERQVVRRAVEIGNHLLTRATHDRQLNALVERMDEWRQLIRRRALAVLELQKINRACRDFKTSIGGSPSLPCDVSPRALLGFGDIVSMEPHPFLQSVLQQGIITKGEVDRHAAE